MSFFKRLLGKEEENFEQEEAVMERESVSEVSYTDNTELIAVISAAVATMMNQGISDINIQTIRRIPQNSIVWADMGRKEQMLNSL